MSEHNEPDFFLQHLLSVMEHTGSSFSLTVTIGGAIVSGDVISGQAYFDLLSKHFAEANYGGTSPQSAAEKFFQDVCENVKNQCAETSPSNAEDFGNSKPIYIQMKNARLMSPTGHGIPTPGNLWRGKLTSVDSYMVLSFN